MSEKPPEAPPPGPEREGASKAEVESPEPEGAYPVHVWKRGDKLETVLRRRYDIPANRDWTDSLRLEALGDLVLWHNGLKDAKRIPEGQKITLPPREEIFIDAGSPAEFREALRDLVRVESLYYARCEEAMDYMCNKKRAIPKEMKADFEYMTEKGSTLEAKLETKKTTPPSMQLKKALRSLGILHQTFTFTINYRKFDEEHCDFAAKDITATKRTFSNLAYQLYRWSQEESARAGGPSS